MSYIRLLHNNVSEGLNNLKEALEGLGHSVVKIRVSNAKSNYTKFGHNVKWGCFGLQYAFNGGIMNLNADQRTLNKKACFGVLSEAAVPIPEYTNSAAIANDWLRGGGRVYERHSLTGSGGEGIRVVEGESSNVSSAPLYTKGLKGKRREYRIHVFQCEGVKRIFVQQKVRRQGYLENDHYSNNVRNLENGWVFAHNEITAPRTVTVGAAVAAVKALGLTFGAVDLIEMDKIAGGSYVLEVNSAPGLQGATVGFYANAISDVTNNVIDQEGASE